MLELCPVRTNDARRSHGIRASAIGKTFMAPPKQRSFAINRVNHAIAATEDLKIFCEPSAKRDRPMALLA